jgi:hypothetical protein
MTAVSPYIISLIIALLLIVPLVAQESDEVEGIETSETIPAGSSEDSTVVVMGDSLAIVASDSLSAESGTRGNLVQGLFTPIVLTAFIGGIVYLIFTQRGR